MLFRSARAGQGVAVLPWYVAREAVAEGSMRPLLPGFMLPAQELHAVYPSPKMLPSKVATFIAFLQARLADSDGQAWWQRPVLP